MAIHFLLDTNILAEPLRPKPNENVLRRLKKYDGQLATASVVWHEMWLGCLRLPRGRRRNAIEQYLVDVLQPTLPLLPYSPGAARWHAEQRARLTAAGKTPSFVDGQIASVAVERGLTLVTHNVSDFEGFACLETVDWRGKKTHRR